MVVANASLTDSRFKYVNHYKGKYNCCLIFLSVCCFVVWIGLGSIGITILQYDNSTEDNYNIGKGCIVGFFILGLGILIAALWELIKCIKNRKNTS